MSKKLIYGSEARKGLKAGVDAVANAVKVTMGAKGLPVAIDQPYTTPLVTKDGVTVAENIRLSDPLLNMGANMIIAAAKKTNDLVGDGSTSATVLTQAIVEEGLKAIEEGVFFYDMKKGMEFAVDKITENLTKQSFHIKEDYNKMKAIATISANNDAEMGALVSNTFREVGEHGFISVEESKSSKTTVEVSNGLKYKMSPDSQFFYQDTVKKTSELKDAKIFLYIGRINTEAEVLPILNLMQPTKPLIIVCNEIDPLLLSRLVNVKLQKTCNIVVMKSPSFGEYREEAMEDIALLTGAKLFLQETDDDISQVTLEDLGTAEKVLIDEENTSFIEKRNNEKVEAKINQLKELQEKTEDSFEVNDFKERIARLKGSVARIFIGGVDEMQMKEKKDRLVDAVNALSVAYKDGVVIGGGVALINASRQNISTHKKSPAFKKGVEIILKAVSSPVRQILSNAGYKTEDRQDIIISKIKGNKGFNVLSDKHSNFIKDSILDPVGVTKSALNNALSIATTFLSVDCVMIDTTNWKENPPQFEAGI